MAKKIESGSRISVNSAYKALNDYPYISKIIGPSLDVYKNSQHPPLIDQVNPLIQQLHCYGTDNCNKCENLLQGMDGLLERMNDCSFLNKNNLLKNLSRAKDEYAYRSVESELLLANFFFVHGIDLLEYEPKGKNKKRADFKISLNSHEIMVELITPNFPKDDYAEKERSLIEKLRRIESGLLIEISGFELYDRSTLWSEKVEPPSNQHIEEIVTNFRRQAKISSRQMPIELTLCTDYPRIKISILEKVPDYPLTIVQSGASRTGEAFPLRRIIRMVLDERKHFSPDNINFVFIDFSYWNRPWFDPDIYFRDQIVAGLEKSKSSRINAIFSYLVSAQNDFALISKGVLYQELKESPVFQNAIKPFLEIWN